MISEQIKRAHAIFVAALERPQHERNAYVQASCGTDASLQREVHKLFGAVEHTTDFLETPAIGSNQRIVADRLASPPYIIPGYRILRTLGVGGMASVYEAQQDHPRRLVALKVMHRSLAENSGLQRFRFEIEVLGRLKHSGIAQIHEAGTIDDEAGRPLPFFSMELVDDALPLTKYASQYNLDLRKRLMMFVTVCDAVRCGHQAGVVHRDLKPSNVLVNSAHQVKVIDFGIARSLGPVETPITIDAERSRLIGTLNYMSPEQCAGSDVDMRSDVYSLGVILYELVTGKLPHDLSQTSITEAIRVIQGVVPARPGAVNRHLAGDLELIILTAIDKDRDRRYASASELAADIRRFLANQPIHARPPTLVYQARKFAQRHRALASGSALLLFILVAAVLVSSRWAIVAHRARLAAEARERELERTTEFYRAQLRELDIAAMGARIRASLVDKLVPSSLTIQEADELLAPVNFPSLALTVVQHDILDRAHLGIDERFADHPLLRANLLQALAETMNALGLPDRAKPVLADALDIRHTALGPDHPDTLASTQTMGLLLGYLGDYEASHKTLHDTYERRARTLGHEHPETLATANSLGGALRYLGKLEEAEALWQQTLDIRRRTLGDDDPATLVSLNNVGVAQAMQGNLVGAEAAWRELLERRRRLLGEDHPTYRNGLTNYGLILVEQGKLKEARPYLEESLAALLETKGESHRSTLSTMGSLAEILAEMNDPEAGSLLRRCLRARSEAFGPDHPATLRSRAKLAAYNTAQGEYVEAAKELESVLAIQRSTLGPGHADTIDTVNALSTAYLRLDRKEEAHALAVECVERCRQLTPDAKVTEATLLIGLGRSLVALERFAEAESTLVAARDALKAELGEENPRTQIAVQALADLHLNWDDAKRRTADRAPFRDQP